MSEDKDIRKKLVRRYSTRLFRSSSELSVDGSQDGEKGKDSISTESIGRTSESNRASRNFNNNTVSTEAVGRTSESRIVH